MQYSLKLNEMAHNLMLTAI